MTTTLCHNLRPMIDIQPFVWPAKLRVLPSYSMTTRCLTSYSSGWIQQIQRPTRFALYSGSSVPQTFARAPLRRVNTIFFRTLSSLPNDQDARNKKIPLPKRILSAIPTHENIYTLPNFLTFSRLLAAPVLGYLVLHDYHLYALSLFFYAGVTDLVDGYIARKWSLQTVVGTIIDPMADKALMTVLTVCLAVQGALPLPLALIILGRDAALGIAAIYYRYISLPPPKTMARYWDFSLPSAEVHPTGISKINTFLQLGLIGWTMGMPLIGAEYVELMAKGLMGMQWLVAGTTIWSGASYVWSKDAIKILTPRGEGNERRKQ